MLASLGPLSFATPAALLALLLLPALWWLLRVIPPTPRRVRFPPLRLIAGLTATETSVERTPPWLLLLRLLLAVALILAAAGPLLNAAPPLPGTGPVIVLLDDGWAAAHGWVERRQAVDEVLARAERQDRRVILATTAPTAATDAPPSPMPSTAVDARQRLQALTPRPWPTARAAAVRQIADLPDLQGSPPGVVFWFADGLDEPAGGPGFGELARALRPFGGVVIVAPEPSATALLLREPRFDGGDLQVPLALAAPAAADVDLWLRGRGEDGAVLLREPVRIAAEDRTPTATLSAPMELINRLARLDVESQATAGAVVLVDERWRRRPVGLIASEAGDLPLLSDAFYLERALEPFAEVRRGDLTALLGRDVAVLILPDGGVPAGPPRDRLAAWIDGGGVLVRFAGPRLAAGTDPDDPLLPVRLRTGERTMGGALAWREPARLAPFDPAGPFAGLAVPEDVEVLRQVLAEPSLELEARTWAKLDDGTPLVTAAARGDGRVILFHTTPNPEWSSLALSGLYVEMLERIVRSSRGIATATGQGPLLPVATLDGFGGLGPPPPEAQAIGADAIDSVIVGPQHPPGIYGRSGGAVAVNLGTAPQDPRALGPLPSGVDRQSAAATRETDLLPWLLTAALVLALADLAVSLVLRGLVPWPRRRAAAAGAAAVLGVLATAPAGAQEVIADGTAPPATLETRLAYVVSGDAAVDELSFLGLRGLSLIIGRRTSVELADPVAVDPARDPLDFYPLLYWPVVADAPPPSPAAVVNVRRFMANGGTILFDTRDAGRSGQSAAVQRLAQALEIPPLIAVPADHVLARAYYLLDSFPGRFAGGAVWVERTGDRYLDGVSPVIAGSHDWAAAWAVDEVGRPLLPVVPGGEGQREMAFRFGVNLVMYVLAGSYKTDQVHLPAILERLGQ